MLERIATLLVASVGVYLVMGILCAVPFVIRGVGAVDPDAQRGSRGFRLLILPGAVALWPLLAIRWRQGRPPRSGSTAHDLPSRRGVV